MGVIISYAATLIIGIFIGHIGSGMLSKLVKKGEDKAGDI